MKKDKKTILALDQSTTATGWVLFNGDKIEDYGIFEPKGDRNKRIEQTRVWLNDMINTLSNEKGIKLEVVLEEIQMQGNVETFKSLAHLQGVLINLCFQKLKSEELSSMNIYYASSWKSTCGVTGRKRAEQKANAQKHVLNKYGIEAPEDACDAICLGEHHLYQSKSVINFE